MSFEDRIQESVDRAFADLRARLEQEVKSIAAEEQARVDEAARRQAADAAAAELALQVADAEARARATVDAQVADARAEERDKTAAEVRHLVEIEAEHKLAAALANAETTMKLAVEEANARSGQMVSESVISACAREREAELAALSRLLESIRGLDGAASLTEVLDALGLAAAREAARAAVLMVRHDRLVGWRLSGFGPRDAQPKSIDLALNDAGVMGLAVGSGRSATTRESPPAVEGPGFAHLPADRMGLAVPVVVGGRVVAVVYADSVTHDGREEIVPSCWPEVIEILARHAARCLEALTAQKAASSSPPRFWVAPGQPGTTANARTSAEQPSPSEPKASAGEAPLAQPAAALAPAQPEESARRLARLLLSEIKLYHEPAVDEGRRTRSLLSRLAPEIERARRMYDARVPATLRTRAELFQQELIATLAGGDPSLLGASA